MSEQPPIAMDDTQAMRMSRAASTRTWVYTSQAQNPGTPPPESIPDSERDTDLEDEEEDFGTITTATRPLPHPPLSQSMDDYTHVRQSMVAGYEEKNRIPRRRVPVSLMDPGPLPSPHEVAPLVIPPKKRRLPFIGGFVSSVKKAMMMPSNPKRRARSGTAATIPMSEGTELPAYASAGALTPMVERPDTMAGSMVPIPLEPVSYVEATDMPEPFQGALTPLRRSTVISSAMEPPQRTSTLAPSPEPPLRRSTFSPSVIMSLPQRRSTMTQVTRPEWRQSVAPEEGSMHGHGRQTPAQVDPETGAIAVEPLPTDDYAKMGGSSSVVLSDARSRHTAFFSMTTQSHPYSLEAIGRFFSDLYHLPWVAKSHITHDYVPGEGMPNRKKWDKGSISWYNTAAQRQSLDLVASTPASPITPVKRAHHRPGRERSNYYHRDHYHHPHRYRSQHHRDAPRSLSSRQSTALPRHSSRTPSRNNSAYRQRYFQPAQPMYIIPSPMMAPPAEVGGSTPVPLTSPLLMMIPSLPAPAVARSSAEASGSKSVPGGMPDTH